LSLFTSFYRFETSTNFSSNTNGASSVAFVAGSDVGSLLMALSSDQVYHFTQAQYGLHEANEILHATLVSLDSDGATPVPIAAGLDFHTPNAPNGRTTVFMPYDPPIRVRYGTAARFVSMNILLNDSDSVPSLAYSGFTTPAA